MKVDRSSGRRTPFLSPTDHELYKFISFMGAADRMGRELIFIANAQEDAPVFVVDTSTKVLRAINQQKTGIGRSAEFVVNGNYLYIISENTRLQKMHINTGAVQTITASLSDTSSSVVKKIAYDAESKLIYVALPDRGIYVIDEVSGYIAGLSTK